MNLITDAELGQIELQRADRERRDRGVTSCTAVAVTDRVSGWWSEMQQSLMEDQPDKCTHTDNFIFFSPLQYKIASLHSSHVHCALAQLTGVQVVFRSSHGELFQTKCRLEWELGALLTAAGELHVSWLESSAPVLFYFFFQQHRPRRWHTLPVSVWSSTMDSAIGTGTNVILRFTIEQL